MKYVESIVAIVDILGFKDLVNDDSKVEEIGAILKIPYVMRNKKIKGLLKLRDVEMTSISDSFVFSIDVKKESAMNKTVRLLYTLNQVLLLEYGLLLRGGIAVGKLYHDSEVVYGPGLVKAHELEKDISVYPRMVMSENDFEEAIKRASATSQKHLRRQFNKKEDGFYELDCFYHMSVETLELCSSKLEAMSVNNLRAQKKINWLKATIDDNYERSMKAREMVKNMSFK